MYAKIRNKTDIFRYFATIRYINITLSILSTLSATGSYSSINNIL